MASSACHSSLIPALYEGLRKDGADFSDPDVGVRICLPCLSASLSLPASLRVCPLCHLCLSSLSVSSACQPVVISCLCVPCVISACLPFLSHLSVCLSACLSLPDCVSHVSSLPVFPFCLICLPASQPVCLFQPVCPMWRLGLASPCVSSGRLSVSLISPCVCV